MQLAICILLYRMVRARGKGWSTMLAPLLGLLGVAHAFDCKKLNLGDLDKTIEIKNNTSTPPTVTEQHVYYNPCSPAKGDKGCGDDNNFCLVETIDGKTTAVKPFGSHKAGAREQVHLSSEDIPEEYLKHGSPEIVINYESAQWGRQELYASALFYCQEKDEKPYIEEEYGFSLVFKGPQYCVLSDPGNKDGGKDGGNKDGGNKDDKKEGGSGFGGFLWGVFKLLFYLGFVAGLLWIAKTVYVNYAQSRGSLPINADLKDVLSDLPYLFRDAMRKVTAFFTNRGNSGYSAL